MVSRIRSSNGCWTCRLRRKKCDEKKPHCRRCSKLHLECSYSEKPVWMDGGELQKLKLEQTKQLVRRGMGLSCKRRTAKPQSQDLHMSSDDSVPNSPIAVTGNLRESSFPAGDEFGIESDLVYLEPASFNDNDLEIFFRLGEISDTGKGVCWPDHSYDHGETQGNMSSGQQDSQSPGVHNLYDFANPGNQDCNSLLKSQGLDPSSKNSFSNLSSSGYQIPFAQRLSSPEEADLLLYYMESVCEKQFMAVAKVNRGWLYMAITKADLVYWATLSLASYYKGSKSVTSTYFYNNLAILELRKTLLLIEFQEEKSLSQILDYCFSIIQLMFFEKLRGNFESCKMHLNAASNLLVNFQSGAATDGTSETPIITSGTDSVNSAMLHLVVGTLRWFDVLLSCSLQDLPSTSAQLPGILRSNNGPTQIADKITYQSLVLETLAEVLELDHWKATVAKAGRLSVVELVKRAATIESNIMSAQGFIEANGDGTSGVPECMTGKTMFIQVANIFISTTRVYLQVIVSGSHRQVPEISKGVSHTVGLFRDLLDTKMLTHLVWPFCFIGCLATGNDRELVSRLANDAVSQTDCPLNLKSARAIMEECWRLLDEGVLADPDWVTAMKSLDCQVILF